MSAFNVETVLNVRHWNEELFSFNATRDPSFRFKNGQFTMIGLEVEGRRYELGPGDAYFFDSRKPHAFRNLGDGELIVVSACTPPSF